MAVLLAGMGVTGPVAAEVRRCTAPDGSTIFTDKPCSALGAVERIREPGAGRSAHAVRTRCMASIDELVFEMSLALDAGDANRLAGVYHWTGMSSRTAYAAVERLDRIASRPLVDIVPVYPEPDPPPLPPPPMPTPDAAAGIDPAPLPYTERLASRHGAASATPEAAPAGAGAGAGAVHEARAPEALAPDAVSVAPLPTSPRPPRPTGIKLVQTLANGSTPSTTVFGLTRHFGCWWIRD